MRQTNGAQSRPRLDAARRAREDGELEPSACDGEVASCSAEESGWRVLVCILGSFRVLGAGRPVKLHSQRAQLLLCRLALQREHGVPRDTLLQAAWPSSEPALAGQSLNSLVYSLHKRLGKYLGGDSPVVRGDGYYRLNTQAGIGVDAACFEALVAAGGRRERAGDRAAFAESYRHAVPLYRGDLCTCTDVQEVIERERLRALYLTALRRLADYSFGEEDYEACLACALRLLAADPCREDAHRLVMHCYVRRGERAQALRQYHTCAEVLRTEFGVTPEPATTALFERVRFDPASV